MAEEDRFIIEANAALKQDGDYDVRRAADGGVDMIASDGSVIACFSRDISAYDLVGASITISGVALDQFNVGERSMIRMLRGQIDKLKAKHGKSLTAQHIEDLILSCERWYSQLDAEEAAMWGQSRR
jgi:hypothetical protein